MDPAATAGLDPVRANPTASMDPGPVALEKGPAQWLPQRVEAVVTAAANRAHAAVRANGVIGRPAAGLTPRVEMRYATPANQDPVLKGVCAA